MESESKSARLRESRVREARVREAEREREEVVGRAVEAAERSATQVRRTRVPPFGFYCSRSLIVPRSKEFLNVLTVGCGGQVLGQWAGRLEQAEEAAALRDRRMVALLRTAEDLQRGADDAVRPQPDVMLSLPCV